MNLELEVTPTYHLDFYIRYQTYLRLAEMELDCPQCVAVFHL